MLLLNFGIQCLPLLDQNLVSDASETRGELSCLFKDSDGKLWYCEFAIIHVNLSAYREEFKEWSEAEKAEKILRVAEGLEGEVSGTDHGLTYRSKQTLIKSCHQKYLRCI